MKEIIERLNNLVAVLEEAEGKAEELEIAKVRIGELEAQLVAKDEEVAVAKARVAELEETVVVKDSEIATAKAEIERINKENEETRANELAQLDEAIARLEAIVNK